MVWYRNHPIKLALLCVATLILMGNASSKGEPGHAPVKPDETVVPSQVGNDPAPSKVTGQGIYQHFYVEDPETGVELYPSDEEVGLFSMRIEPNEKSPQAVIHVDGVALREVWGGPLDLQEDVVACIPSAPYRPEDLKPGQYFVFVTEHPTLGDVQIGVYFHDNVTPGYYAEDATWSDWIALVIEPLGGDGEPGTEDDLFNAVGIVTSGDIMDHRLDESDYVPSRVTGEGIYEHFLVEDPETGVELYPSDDEVGLFSINIDPEGMSPQAEIHMDGVALREVWGGPLVIQEDFVACIPSAPYRPEDLKPGQTFVFFTQHPVLGEVQVAVYVHDNCTPGYNTSETPNWSDWIALVIEPLDGDDEPGTEDDLFNAVGIVTSGNIMDHRLDDNSHVPSAVTGLGIYQHYEDPLWGEDLYPSDDDVGLFSIRIDPEGKSPQAIIRVDGVALREVWGRPLVIQEDFLACIPSEPYRPEDLKPGQTFVFRTQHAALGEVQVAVYIHDNCTPGYNTLESRNWSDWFSLIIEPLDGDGQPGTEDDLFNSVGIVTSGDIMDHR